MADDRVAHMDPVANRIFEGDTNITVPNMCDESYNVSVCFKYSTSFLNYIGM